MTVLVSLCLVSLFFPKLTETTLYRRDTNGCAIDYCKTYNICESNEICLTTPECLIQCLKNVATESELAGPSDSPLFNTTTQAGHNTGSDGSFENSTAATDAGTKVKKHINSNGSIENHEVNNIGSLETVFETTVSSLFETSLSQVAEKQVKTGGSFDATTTKVSTHGKEAADKDVVDTESDLVGSLPVLPVSWDLPPKFPEQENSDTATDNECTVDYCKIYNICDSGEVCVLTPGCLTRCLDNTSTKSVNDITTQETTTLRPMNERSCRRGVKCKHGVMRCTETSFSCICDDGWIGDFCMDPCDLPCIHGQCQVSDSMYCNCKHEYTGKWCDELIPDPEERQRILAIVLSSALVVVLLLAIAVPVILWHLRVIFVLKLVYFFKEYEDDDGKMFDAYVSMTPTSVAEDFVYGSLRTMLENQNFKIYLQARDAPAGEVISETILSALEKSRRTIMIITPDYIRNEWNRFEYLIAQQETLKLQQRIIPIILEDVEKERVNMDKSLKHILTSIKCLKFPEAKQKIVASDVVELSEDIQSPDSIRSNDSTTYFYRNGRSSSTTISKEEERFQKKVSKFWKRLMLTMPKKKTQENESLNCFAKLRKHKSYDINESLTEKNAHAKYESVENNKQPILEINYRNNFIYNTNNDELFNIKIINNDKVKNDMKGAMQQ